jgi:hypothetical protein
MYVNRKIGNLTNRGANGILLRAEAAHYGGSRKLPRANNFAVRRRRSRSYFHALRRNAYG